MMNLDQYLNNKVIIITGASSGIGKELAIQYAKYKTSLVLAARDISKLNTLKESLKDQVCEMLVVQTDISVKDDCELLIKTTINSFGKIDILINNAGISQRSLAKDTSIEVDRKLMDVNFFGPVLLTKYALPHMLRQQTAHIVVISSISGKFGFHLRSGYAASKHALHGYFEALRLELCNNSIDVTIVCPGIVKTNMSINALTHNGAKYEKTNKELKIGISAEKCADKIIKAIQKRKKEVFIGGKEIFPAKMKNLFPNLFYSIAKKVHPTKFHFRRKLF